MSKLSSVLLVCMLVWQATQAFSQSYGPNLVTNPGAETGDTSGWKIRGNLNPEHFHGAELRVDGNWDVSSPPNRSGSHRFTVMYDGTLVEFFQYQTVDVLAGHLYQIGLSATQVDGSDQMLELHWCDGEALPGWDLENYVPFRMGGPGLEADDYFTQGCGFNYGVSYPSWTTISSSPIKPASNKLTIALYYRHIWPSGHSVWHVDDIFVREILPAPVPTPTPGGGPAGNLLVNPGAETGNLAGWSWAGNVIPMINPGTHQPAPANHSGSYRFGWQVSYAQGCEGLLYQTIPVEHNTLYEFGFFATKQDGQTEYCNVYYCHGDVTAPWKQLLSLPNAKVASWTHFGGQFRAIGDKVTLVFRFQNHWATGNVAFHVDDCYLVKQNGGPTLTPPAITATATPTDYQPEEEVVESDIVINEVHFHPADDTGEFIELTNVGSVTHNLTGWQFTNGIGYPFLTGTHLAPGQFLVIAGDPALVQSRYGITGVQGPWAGNLNNSGEVITLRNAAGVVADKVEYNDADEWPTSPDGRGPSLECINPQLPNDKAGNWAPCSATPLAQSPSRANSTAAMALPPYIRRVEHYPVNPSPNQPVRVSAKVTGDSLSQVQVKYDFATGPSWSQSMRDDGVGADLVADDACFSAYLPASPQGTLVHYWIEAQSSSGGTSRDPLPDARSKTWGYYVSADPGAAVPVYHVSMPEYAFDSLHSGALVWQELFYDAEIFADGVLYSNVNIRNRGMNARLVPKKSFRVELNSDRKWASRTELDLNGGWSDKTYMRDMLATGLNQQAGLPASDIKHVRLYVNGACRGLYLDVEPLNEDFLQRCDRAGEGALYKARGAEGLSADGSDLGSLANYEAAWRKITRESEDCSDLQQLLAQLNSAAAGAPLAQHFSTHWNTADVANYLALQSCFAGADMISKNYYLYRDLPAAEGGTGKWSIFPWDLDLTFGRCFLFECGYIWNDTLVNNQSMWYGSEAYPKIDGPWNRIIDRFFQTEPYRTHYQRRLKTLLLTEFTAEKLHARIEQLRTLLAGEIAVDYGIWNYQWGYTERGCSTNVNWSGMVDQLKVWITNRRQYLLNQLGHINIDLSKTVVINEVLTDNRQSVVDEYGEHDDFIELYNPGALGVDLSGMYLSDDVVSPKKYQFAAGTTLRAGGFLCVWADGSPGQGPLHANFALSKDGETVALTDTDTNANRQIDRMDFPALPTDCSWGQVPDGPGAKMMMTYVSWCAPNVDPSAPTPTRTPQAGTPTPTAFPMGDANRDRFVSGLDFRNVRDRYGMSDVNEGDANGDRFVNLLDFRAVRDHYGTSYGP